MSVVTIVTVDKGRLEFEPFDDEVDTQTHSSEGLVYFNFSGSTRPLGKNCLLFFHHGCYLAPSPIQ